MVKWFENNRTLLGLVFALVSTAASFVLSWVLFDTQETLLSLADYLLGR